MNLRYIVNKAVKAKPLPSLSWLYGDYYSPYYSLMYLLAKTIEDGFLVELGVESGRGLVSMAIANRSNLVIGFDSHQHPDLMKNLRGFPNALFTNLSSMPVPRIITSRQVSLLHIDTEHSYSMAFAEFEAYKPYLAKGAYVLFDDLHAQNDGVKAFFDTLPYEKIEDDRLHPSCGYGVMIYE